MISCGLCNLVINVLLRLFAKHGVGLLEGSLVLVVNLIVFVAAYNKADDHENGEADKRCHSLLHSPFTMKLEVFPSRLLIF